MKHVNMQGGQVVKVDEFKYLCLKHPKPDRVEDVKTFTESNQYQQETVSHRDSSG